MGVRAGECRALTRQWTASANAAIAPMSELSEALLSRRGEVRPCGETGQIGDKQNRIFIANRSYKPDSPSRQRQNRRANVAAMNPLHVRKIAGFAAGGHRGVCRCLIAGLILRHGKDRLSGRIDDGQCEKQAQRPRG